MLKRNIIFTNNTYTRHNIVNVTTRWSGTSLIYKYIYIYPSIINLQRHNEQEKYDKNGLIHVKIS